MGSMNSTYRETVFTPPDSSYAEKGPYEVIKMKPPYCKYSGNGRCTCTTTSAYFLKSNTSTNTTIIYSHGNACDIGIMRNNMVELKNRLNVNVLIYEYTGYGLDRDNEPSEYGCYKSADTAIHYLHKTLMIPYKNIIVMGESVGSGPSCYIAEKYPVGGLILEGPFVSCINVISSFLATIGKFMDTFPNYTRIQNIKCPCIIMHGNADTIIDVDNTIDLWDYIPKQYRYEKIIVDGADHHEIRKKYGRDKYYKKLSDFIEHCSNFKYIIYYTGNDYSC
uniref:Alpha/beta hydrolase family protein n=1 Tax=Mimivirus LCMiAC01 TaxID=2506608 RepID=A0A481Z000_9VIRU|nr:MAG: alpha/beta hydrolase family protein [Mimivirus LCMiAC01]